MKSFANLSDAGEKLAELVRAEYSRSPVVVLAVVPNGVPVALPVGRDLGVQVLALPVLRTDDGPIVFEVPPVTGLHVIVIDDGVGDTEFWLAIAPGGAFEKLERSGPGPAKLGCGEGIGRASPEADACVGHGTPWGKCRMVHFIEVVKHNPKTPNDLKG